MSNTAELTKFIADLEEASNGAPIVEEVLDIAADEIFLDQVAHVPVGETGRLKGTIHVESRPGWRFIGPKHEIAPYDVYVARGTAAHEITPKTPGGVLVFTMGGQTVFAKRVQHPGTKAQPWDADSLQRWHESLGDKMSDVVVNKVMGRG